MLGNLDIIDDLYKKKLDNILSNQCNIFNNNYKEIEDLQKSVIKKLNLIGNDVNNELLKYKNKSYIDSLIIYLNELTFNNIDYDKIKEIENFIKNTHNNELDNIFYHQMYLIVKLEMIILSESKTYNNLDDISKKRVEEQFVIELKNDKNEIIFKEYLNIGFKLELLLKLYDNERIINELEAEYKTIDIDKYQQIGYFSEGLAVVREMDDSWGYINTNGEKIIPSSNVKYDYACPFSDGLALVKIDKKRSINYITNKQKYCYIDKNGNEVIKCQYKNIQSLSNGLFLVKSLYTPIFSFDLKLLYNYKYEYRNLNNKIVFTYIGMDAKGFTKDGLARVLSNNSLWGYINGKGRETIKCQYLDAKDFSEGLAAVRGYDLWGYIDKNGTIVIDFKYEEAYSFGSELARVRENGKYKFINKNGLEHKVFKSLKNDIRITSLDNVFNEKKVKVLVR